ncbi:uncharacterized protein LOC131428764 [Malaya genurostris]|uniref:uncharacterized protein LOC131428764 n=1 Tax=Malaya genurostris TaxID=325434 RepID=UPI0026F3CE48|nr:uncharacterized protein LOC131428764 [Malaya genurostris]
MPAAGTSTTRKPPSMRALTAKLKEIQLSFSDIWRFVQSFKESCKVTEVEVRLGKLEEIWESFSETFVEILYHDDYNPEGSAYEKERMEFSDNYYEVKAFLMEKVKMLQEPQALEQSMRSGEAMQLVTDHVRLPQIKLQTFNGNVDEWLSFRDLFTSLIHWKVDLPEVEKFHYLKGCLQGEPKSLIDPLQITKANYQVAWEMLLRRYNNSKQLKKRQIQSLFNLPTLSKESVADLHTLVEGFERIVQTLDQIIQPTDYKDLLLVNILTTRLDPVTRRGWEEVSATKENDTLSDMSDFLRRRMQVLDCLPLRAVDNKDSQRSSQLLRQKQIMRISHSSSQSSGGRCVACSSDHLLHQCNAFQRMVVTDRDALLKTHVLCRNCFRTGHQARECQSKYSCRNCKGRHHTLVCFKPERNKNPKAAVVAEDNGAPAAESPLNPSPTQVANLAASDMLVTVAAHQYATQVILATAVVLIEDNTGNRLPARALLDSGSESNFITERLAQRMQFSRDRVDISILGIGQTKTKVKHRIRAVIRSRTSAFSRELGFLVLPKVTVNLPSTTINTDRWSIPTGIQLADPAFFESQVVDLVLGIEPFFEIFETGRRISISEGLPTLNKSAFGWVICGGIANPSQSSHISCNVSTLEGLDEMLSRFWSCEEVELSNPLSPEEKRCEELFLQSVHRNANGRYTVTLPKREDIFSRLGESRDISYRRLQGTERRLAKNLGLRDQYSAFMEEYVSLGHMRKVDDASSGSVKRCYLPHHPVIKEPSTTTKVRVVFDASCKTSSGTSLNDVLLVGPVIQDDLRSIILRSRTKQIMLVSDVEKMFRQINVCQEDRAFQCILWRERPTDKVDTYELGTVTYGTKSAPFLATRILHQLALDEEERYPLAARAVIYDTYMDDVITGADDIDIAIKLQAQLEAMMAKGGFRLRKWASNCSLILNGVPEEDRAIRISEGIDLDPDSSIKTLGLTWMLVTDTLKFQFTVPALETGKALTKRYILSTIATLFDPLGLLGAAITSAKIFMQQLWALRDESNSRVGWDQPLPSTVGESWIRYHEQLPVFNQLRIDRCVIIPEAVKIVIHCFSDASEKAYGACLYLQSQNAEGKFKVRLLSSKSKVAPLKCQTIPRLELCGALLAAQLYGKVKSSIGINAEAFFWTDSTCVLRWIQAIPTTWSPFVANRTAKIQTITEGCQWRHVPGIQNPADLISRGINPKDIIQNTFWWQGPDWLEKGQDDWPESIKDNPSDEGEAEKRRTAVVGTVSVYTNFNQEYIGKFSSYNKLIRHTAYWLRLIKLLQLPAKDRHNEGFLTTEELKQAECTLARRVQKEVFLDEWKTLSMGTALKKGSPLRWYNPFISKDQLIRLGGRLKYAHGSEDTKHPIVLPARHQFTYLILLQYHERLLHAGPQLLLAAVRLHFWPLGGRNVARHIVRKCLKCYRLKPTPIQQFMGDLPPSRVTASRPFTRSGVDYFGPVYVRTAPRRVAVKAYVSIFICLCTKAVHLELVTDLSTDRFLQALRRFIARRGRCVDMYSDNGTNFVGARNKMEEFLRLLKNRNHHEVVSRECAKEGIQWHFNPPSAPHFGGLWEAAVRSAKNHLLKVVGETPMSSEDFNTLLVQVEGCLNSRPLTPMSDDPNDLEPLTPAHFLIGSSIHALPEPDLTTIPINRLQHWQLTQRRLQDFWTRWRREYLCQLQARTRRWKPAVQIEVGKLVVIKDDNQPPLKWKMGRICDTHPGKDGVVRVVTLRTATGLLTRPVEKICFLPIANEETKINKRSAST